MAQVGNPTFGTTCAWCHDRLIRNDTFQQFLCDACGVHRNRRLYDNHLAALPENFGKLAALHNLRLQGVFAGRLAGERRPARGTPGTEARQQ